MAAEEHLAWERAWWDDVSNTFGEERKQLTYARLMGLPALERDGRFPVYELEGRSVVDIGGGPASMLLKTTGGADLLVVDPCEYPAWVSDRYSGHGIALEVVEAEEFRPERKQIIWPARERPGQGFDVPQATAFYEAPFDEAWIYNVLQHVQDPEKVIAAARGAARLVRIFDWLETPASPGHPHTLHADDLDRWLAGHGAIGSVNENGAVGLAYWGVFPT